MSTKLWEFIIDECKEKGITLSQLQEKSGLSFTVLEAIRHGRTNIKTATKQKLAAALGCSIGDIQEAIQRSEQNLLSGEALSEEQEPSVMETVNKLEAMIEESPRLHRTPEPVEEIKEDKPVKVAVPDPAEDELLSIKLSADQRSATIKAGPHVIELPPPQDMINHPSHYTQGGIECIEALKASMSTDEFRGYLKGCQMKYMWRYRLKNGVEDLKKARWYLNRLISEMEDAPDE